MIADWLENLRVAWDGLTANKMRSGLTMLGVIIGVAAVIALVSIGTGAQTAITEQITSIGTNLIFVMPGAVTQGGVRGAVGGAVTLTYDDAKALADPVNVPDATVVVPEFSRNTQVIYGESNLNVQVIGTTPAYQQAYQLELASGRFLEEREVDRRATVAVLGAQAAEDLFGEFDPVGQKIKLATAEGAGGRVSLTVIGVLKETGSQLFGTDEAIIVPITTAQTKVFNGRNPLGQPVVTRVTIAAASEDRVEAAESQIDALLRNRHGLTSSEEADFRVMKQEDMLEMATEVTGIMTFFLGAIAAISLLVGGIGIMNIMLVSVTERTREIGIRKAVGARHSDILAQFLTEAVLLSLLGGGIGILVGMGIARLVDAIGVVNTAVSAGSVVLAVGFSAAVGLFFGIYPASRAAGLNPIEALRYE